MRACRWISFGVVAVLACTGDPPLGDPSDGDSDGGDPGDGDSDSGDPGDADPPAWNEVPIHVPAGKLCDIPPDYVQSGGDAVFIPCEVEADRLSDRDPNAPAWPLRIVAWNVHFGAEAQEVQSTLATDATLSAADVLLLTEVARQDLGSNPAGIDQARDLAQALAMDYVFAVEWDRRNIPGKEGEHGVAILSKYPIGNVVVLRHVPVFDWYGEDGRLGGRMTLAADLRVGAELLRVYASHLDNRPYDPVASQDGRNLQGAEIRADAAAPERPAQVVVGGDLNTWVCNPTYFPYPDCTQAPDAEPVVQAFVAQWLDGTAGYNGHTYEESVVVRQRLDWLFLRGLARTAGGVVAGAAGSDHLPLYVDVQR